MTDSLPLTREQILALAPDAQVATAAGGLAHPHNWANLGRTGGAFWGEQQGSADEPYRVAVAVTGPALKCTCPSRKRPCKHSLALLLLAGDHSDAFPGRPAPPWVATWLATAGAAPARAAPKRRADPKAQARRAARREQRVAQGVEALGLWLEDLVRQGLGELAGRPPSFWEAQAALLVDAQAPGLARRVRELAALPDSGEGWPGRMLERLARLHLLLESYRRLDAQPADLQAEIREQIGWTQDQEALRAQAGRRDRWVVVGRQETKEDRLRVQRTWLWGLSSRAPALLLDFAVGRRPFAHTLAPGTAIDAELVFWPSPLPLRALVKEQYASAALDALPGYPTLEAGLAAYAGAVARNPWLEHLLLPLEGALPVQDGALWAVRDAAGCSLPLAMPPADAWRLFAASGGHPITLVAVWDGERLYPLGAWTGREYAPLGGEP